MIFDRLSWAPEGAAVRDIHDLLIQRGAYRNHTDAVRVHQYGIATGDPGELLAKLHSTAGHCDTARHPRVVMAMTFVGLGVCVDEERRHLVLPT
jgi:hypothetical protein